MGKVEMEDSKQNTIKQELNKFKNIINTGLGFFGMHAVFTYDYQLDIYDESNNLLVSRTFMEECAPVVEGFKHNFAIVFLDNNNNFVEYRYAPIDGYPDRHLFYKWRPDKYTYSIQIYCKDDIFGIDIDAFDSEEEYKYKKLVISDSDIKIDINNIEQLGNGEDNKRRSLWYTWKKSPSYPMMYMSESTLGNQGIIGKENIINNQGLVERTIEVTSKPHQIKISPVTDGGFCVISKQIVTHPRNKELIEYTTDELNNKLFGLKEYIEKNYPIYSYILNSEYQRSSLTDLLVDNIINEKCDFKRNKVYKNN